MLIINWDNKHPIADDDIENQAWLDCLSASDSADGDFIVECSNMLYIDAVRANVADEMMRGTKVMVVVNGIAFTINDNGAIASQVLPPELTVRDRLMERLK